MLIEYLSLRPRSRFVTGLVKFMFLLGVGCFGVLAQVEASNSLNVTIIGYGRITSNPAGINCGNDVKDCTELYDINTEVVLTAGPQDGDLYENGIGIVQNVVNWSGDCGTTEWAGSYNGGRYNPVVNKVTMDTAKNCVVTFTETPFKILPKHWTGTGNCGYGIDSYGVYYTDGCRGDGDCDYFSYGPDYCRDDDSRRDDDFYKQGSRALNLNVVGGGTITATEGGHEVCSGEYCTAKLQLITRGAEVKLTATASAGYKFSGWSPAQCASPFPMPDNDRLICTATFTPITICDQVTQIPVAECQELLRLYNSTDGANWKDKTGWNQTNTPCSWRGMSCAGGHVTGVHLWNNDLKGLLPDLNLPYLQELTLAASQLSGNIPDFKNLPNLKSLALPHNQLSGNIPDFRLPNLYSLNLINNQLSGNIPNFKNLPNLKSLELGENQLSGNIPNFKNLPNLKYLYLAKNQLSGNIPDFSNLHSLIHLLLHENQLSGGIPDFSNLSNLALLVLQQNQLTGNIPNFSNLPRLEEVLLGYNQLTGNIPDFKLSAPRVVGSNAIGLESNCLRGVIPKFTSFDLAKLVWAAFNNNGGLVAYDAAQEAILNQKDPAWKTRNPKCPAESAKCANPAKYSIATGRVSIPFTDLPTLKTDSPEATGGMAVFKNLRLQFFKDQDFKVVTSTVTPDTSKEPVGDPCHAVYTYATRTLKIPRVEVPSIISTFPAITEGKPINVYEVTLQHIETNPVDLGIVRIKDATLIQTIQ